jgi:hypothetical protein
VVRCTIHFGMLVDRVLVRLMLANLRLDRTAVRWNPPGQNEMGSWDNYSREAHSLVPLHD